MSAPRGVGKRQAGWPVTLRVILQMAVTNEQSDCTKQFFRQNSLFIMDYNIS